MSSYNSSVKIIRIYARSVPHVHGHKRVDDDVTGWSRHQRSTGQTAPTHRSDMFRVEGVKMCCCLLFSG